MVTVLRRAAWFGVVEICGDDTLQRLHLFLVEIVLGGGDVLLTDALTLPRRQAHIRQGSVGSYADQFYCGVAGDGPAHFVLHFFEEELRGVTSCVVIDGSGVDVFDLLIERSAFRMREYCGYVRAARQSKPNRRDF